MSLLRDAIRREIQAAGAQGRPYDEILADLSTNIGWLIAAGSRDRSFRLGRVKVSMSIIETILRENP